MERTMRSIEREVRILLAERGREKLRDRTRERECRFRESGKREKAKLRGRKRKHESGKREKANLRGRKRKRERERMSIMRER